jgi:hypothetical protein
MYILACVLQNESFPNIATPGCEGSAFLLAFLQSKGKPVLQKSHISCEGLEIASLPTHPQISYITN